MAEEAYPKFPRIPRLSRDCIITEKIDGTNGLIFVPESASAPVVAGSRNRWLEPGKQDNFGFAGWVALHAEELRELGPGLHYGEWWGVGIGRGYDIYERRFSLFNVSRWHSVFSDPKKPPRPKCCDVVPYLGTCAFDSGEINVYIAALRADGSYAAPGFMWPEGIVVFHTQGRVLFKKTLENDDKGKEE